MNKITKKLLSVFVVFTMLISCFVPAINVYAINTNKLSVSFRNGNQGYGIVQYSLDDGATWNDVVGNTSNISTNVTGNNLKLKIVPNENYMVDYAGITLNLDGNDINDLSNLGFESSNGYSVDSNIQSVSLDQVEFRLNDNNQQSGQTGGSDTSNYQGNGVSTLNYSINGSIEYTSGGGFDHGISFRINDIPYKADESKMTYTEDTAYERDEHGQLIMGDNNQPIPILDPETLQPITEKTSLTITGDTINYDYDTTTNKVDFTFTMAPGTLITGLKINNQVINNLPKTSDELLAHYTDHRLEIEVNNIDKADTYNIEITARYPNANEEFMGNFLWDYNPQGYTSSDDKILNGTLVFVQAEYDGHIYTTPDEVNALGGVYNWKDAPRKKTYTEDWEGVGEAQFPKGTILTVKVIPDTGYQLVDFGINGGVFDAQEEIGTYSFEVNGGPFHLQATIQQVDDVVKTTSEKVSAGAIVLGDEESMAIGTARLDVKDIELTEDQISNFEAAASGYNVKNYLDISLFNTVFKGTSTDSWDTQVKELENEAEIFLQLEDDVNGEDIVIVHEKHDGTYEIIPTEYLPEYNAIVFKTSSFSNYAIATRSSSTVPVITNNPQTGDNIIYYISVLTLSILGIIAIIYSKKKIFN